MQYNSTDSTTLAVSDGDGHPCGGLNPPFHFLQIPNTPWQRPNGTNKYKKRSVDAHSRNIWCHLEGLWMDSHWADADADQPPAVLDTTGIRLKAENPAR